MSAGPPSDLHGLPWPEGDPAQLRSVAADLGAVQDQLSAQLVPPLRRRIPGRVGG